MSMDGDMDHGGMDHGGMDHGNMDMCSMNMLFTWNWHNSCVVFKWWHIRSWWSFVISMLAIIAITLGYECLRAWVHKWEQHNVSIINGSNVTSSSRTISQYKWKKSVLYGVLVGYSFLLMLVFMTYNGWYMLAVVIGAIMGNRIWGTDSSNPLLCH